MVIAPVCRFHLRSLPHRLIRGWTSIVIHSASIFRPSPRALATLEAYSQSDKRSVKARSTHGLQIVFGCAGLVVSKQGEILRCSISSCRRNGEADCTLLLYIGTASGLMDCREPNARRRLCKTCNSAQASRRRIVFPAQLTSIPTWLDMSFQALMARRVMSSTVHATPSTIRKTGSSCRQ